MVEVGVFESSYWKLKEKEEEILNLKLEISKLKIEIETLRDYMSNDTEAMANEVLEKLLKP